MRIAVQSGEDGFPMESMGMRIAELVNMESPEEVLGEVKIILSCMFADFNFSAMDAIFGDVVRLFGGSYPGYRGCNTHYHDLKHTTDAFLAMARLIHGAFLKDVGFTQRQVELGLISALLHDTGYIQRLDDRTGTGGKYTLTHVQRSIEFTERYLETLGYSEKDLGLCTKCLRCTGFETRIHEVVFDTPQEAVLGKMLGTADIIGQLADRGYLKKLTYLYHEFREANVPGYTEELELMEKTPAFYEFTLRRMERELGAVNLYLWHHFLARWNLDRDLYQEAMDQNIGTLKKVLEDHQRVSHDRTLVSRRVADNLLGASAPAMDKPMSKEWPFETIPMDLQGFATNPVHFK